MDYTQLEAQIIARPMEKKNTSHEFYREQLIGSVTAEGDLLKVK